MSKKIFSIVLECGCAIAEDTGTKEEPDGNAGLIPCYAEYGNDKKAKELCIKSWTKYNKKED